MGISILVDPNVQVCILVQTAEHAVRAEVIWGARVKRRRVAHVLQEDGLLNLDLKRGSFDNSMWSGVQSTQSRADAES